MNLRKIYLPIVLSFLVIALLVAIAYTHFSNTPSLKNKLQLLSKQASQLNLQVNQSILLHSLGISNNYDQLSELTLKIESIQHDFNRLEDKANALKNEAIIIALKNVKLRLNEKFDLIETFKSSHAIYTSSKLFFNKRINDLKNSGSLNPSEQQQIYQLQNIVYDTTPSIIEIASQYHQNKHLKPLIQHAEVIILYKNKNNELIKSINTDQLFFATEHLESVIYQQLIWTYKKTQAIQNIVLVTLSLALLISLYSIIYPSKPNS